MAGERLGCLPLGLCASLPDSNFAAKRCPGNQCKHNPGNDKGGGCRSLAMRISISHSPMVSLAHFLALDKHGALDQPDDQNPKHEPHQGTEQQGYDDGLERIGEQRIAGDVMG